MNERRFWWSCAYCISSILSHQHEVGPIGSVSLWGIQEFHFCRHVFRSFGLLLTSTIAERWSDFAYVFCTRGRFFSPKVHEIILCDLCEGSVTPWSRRSVLPACRLVFGEVGQSSLEMLLSIGRCFESKSVNFLGRIVIIAGVVYRWEASFQNISFFPLIFHVSSGVKFSIFRKKKLHNQDGDLW